MNRFPVGAILCLACATAVVGGACRPVNQSGSLDAATPEPVSSSEPALSQTPASQVPPVPLTDEELADGWLALFDGQTLFGWKSASNADWRVEQGTIVVGSGDKGLLYTTTQFGDYVLRLDFRSDVGANSGIFLHTPPEPEDPAKDCYELNIADADNPFPTGSLVYRLKAEGNFDSQDWQSYEVTVSGDAVTVSLDGRQILDYKDPHPLRRGHIGLQFNQGRVAFRNIRLKPLGLQPLFNGRDLTGWKTYPDMASKFTVTEAGELHVQDGRGQLETERQFGDFVLRLQCKTHAPELNSGIFFRCIPGELMNGYECQVHNGFVDGDRTRPRDCGTGGFFRRQNARFVVADDLTWFHLTLIAGGPQMAAWVNGLQVSDWTDDRAAHENPRQGLRLEPGTLMIQGHDPTTDISFREIQAAELAPRSDVAQKVGLAPEPRLPAASLSSGIRAFTAADHADRDADF
ncbi:MAG: DUF1080 domain-containing protein [Pirellulaceae bacterium]|nr:DUF1080 domain-containing protein [Pirellulaceae bacterium]